MGATGLRGLEATSRHTLWFRCFVAEALQGMSAVETDVSGWRSLPVPVRRTDLDVNGLRCGFGDMHARPSHLTASEEVRIEPTELFDGLPSEELVVTGRDVETGSSILIGRQCPVKIGSEAHYWNCDHMCCADWLGLNIHYRRFHAASAERESNLQPTFHAENRRITSLAQAHVGEALPFANR